MVQRKVANKLGIQHQADHIKPSSCQHQDVKNKGSDLKKIMKKCRSIKVSEPMPLRKTISQPGKPPPPVHSKSLIKPINGSPNYMKSTSSSEAKKETTQVSSRNTQIDLQLDSKNLRSRRMSSTSGNKSATSLTRTSSLKLVRTLTKTPSFKPARTSAKKCSRVSLCSDMNERKATCSSTLKDSKFPAYLLLNPGGTEYEGTSVIKVCPYTYCSLNGHHHTPLPPLKCFLKAKRRSMKTQRSMKMEAFSPRLTKPSGDGTEEFDSPVNFFVEIYANNANSKGDDHDVDEATGGSTQMNAPGADGSRCGNETALESLSQGSLNSESQIGFDENLEHYSEIISQVDIIETHNEDLKRDDVDEEFRGIAAKEESSPWSFYDGDKQEGIPSVDVDHTIFEVIEMEWDEWSFSASHSGDETHFLTESDQGIGDSSEDSDSNMTEEASEAGEDAKCVDTCSQISETLSYDQVSSTIMDEEEEEEHTEIDLHGELTSGKEKMLEIGVPGTFKEVFEADSPLQVPENIGTFYLKDGGFEKMEPFQLEQEEINEDYNEVQKSGDLEAAQTVTICDLCPEMELPIGETGEKFKAGKDDNVAEDTLSEVNDASHDVVDEIHFAESQAHLEVAASDQSNRKPRSNAIAKEDLADKHAYRKWRIRRKRREDEYEESRDFNPREPNFLPIVPEEDAERVDLRHQMMDERKNAEEWMLDHALQKAVTKLAPARKRKVALLVEAFETVLPLPITKCETHFKHSSTSFAHGRIQACN
ncbi:hypothetical protein F3Y22_tig00110705pilonHSYRG00042 [Hibiscus syriacus]|uniref:Calmodulin-binding domain-containing protein n=1 Tax=Hibiscus syriacus TaxID=106335 RepID=A0A6A2ZX72_HIBSY|nr:uncharacterized protein LOC120138777 [Hibiscus syriacus]KAE8695485.1 hypothetical protein F3Y22_tig00110705pilonHSYRG00042 [Hibiscus syriacus]